MDPASTASSLEDLGARGLAVLVVVLAGVVLMLWRELRASERRHTAEVKALVAGHTAALAKNDHDWLTRYSAQEAACAKETGELRGAFTARVEVHAKQVVDLYEKRVADAKAFQDTLSDLVEGSSIAITASTAASNAVHNALAETRVAMGEVREFLRQVREEIRILQVRSGG